MEQCIFCQIVSGNVASKQVYEDDKVLAILDINPANPGHILLLPKEHYAIMPQVPDEILAHMGLIAKQLSHALLKAIGAKGTNVLIANGVVAGQRAPHIMFHIIPRVEGDQVGLELPENQLSETDMKKVQEQLVPAINKLFGLEGEQPEAPEPEKEAEPEKAEEAEEKAESTDLDKLTDFLTK